jgi:ATPase subunit of ABC transporter with duplicated ATPase domains
MRRQYTGKECRAVLKSRSNFFQYRFYMLSTANITMQFGAKPLFENVSVKFGEGNRYGLIGANGCGKSTFMKILGGDLEPSSGNVMLDKGERLGKLRQDQFAYEDMRVLDVVMMGHTEMWDAMSERDTIYANPDASEEDYMRAADLEAAFAESLQASSCACCWRRPCSRTLTYCCSTNRPTTSISTPSAGWKISSTHAIPPWSSSRMTVIS